MSDVNYATGRAYLENEVAQRARHDTAEQVRTTCSFARAERLLGREYHGRFLIELLQNAADAWRSDPRSHAGRSRLAVVVGNGPALLVANQGAVMTPEVVIESLGHIGASTKVEGEAIGHKGIGFKSVLEITHAPEIYSGLQDNEPALAVSFDPRLAQASITRASPHWEELLAGVQGLDPQDEFAAVPILRFPHWVDVLPADVRALASEGFDSVVRLPFDPAFEPRLGLSEESWVEAVREALDDVSDQILLLLGCFADVRVTDRLASTDVRISPQPVITTQSTTADQGREDVRFLRNGVVSSSWRLFRRALPQVEHMAGEVAVGLRYEETSGLAAAVPAVDGGPSAPFHLFFPTRIASGLPFLLHGYFEVDAARTGFYRGSTGRNRAILEALASLAAAVVHDAAQGPGTDLAALVNLMAACDEPEDPLARDFRESVLRHLDRERWIPVGGAGGPDRDRSRPREVFVAKPHLTRQIARVFSPSYVAARARLHLPGTSLDDRALDLIRSRQQPDEHGLWDVVGDLCRPGDLDVWDEAGSGRGFLEFLDLLDALWAEDRRATQGLVDGLRGDSRSRLLPVSGPSGRGGLLPIPDPGEGVAGKRSRLVMARARSTEGEALVPPDDLDLAFLPDGLLASEADIDRAKHVGVRPFTVDNVLDRLNGISTSPVDPEELLRFLWRLLARERASGFGTKRSAERAAVFDPSQWFWCRPGRAREDDTARLRQQRERYLGDVPLPARDGQWRPAASLGFGADWADWLGSPARGGTNAHADQQRAAAYRALEAISPGPEALLAPPDSLLPFLESQALNDASDPDLPNEQEDDLDDARRDAERHAFLLRLGVWEVPPLEAFESRSPANRQPFPWTGAAVDLQWAEPRARGWTFGLDGWGGARHHNVYLAEDYRFAWSLEESARRDPAALAEALRHGVRLYADRLHALVFCPQCADRGGSHRVTRLSTSSSGYPSLMAVQLMGDHWIACTLDGSTLDQPTSPAAAWWRENAPSGAGLRQSPWRFVPLCGPATGVTEDLRRLAGISTLADANLSKVRALLTGLRDGYTARALEIDPDGSSSARQAFIGLHRLAYERLADLTPNDPTGVAAALSEGGVLCELGDGLVYRQPAEARHDDGTYSVYVRHFAGTVPLLVLPRDQGPRAALLGVKPLVVRLARRGDDDGEDVTDEVHAFVADRIPELLAIVVNHSLGTQTLELGSVQFEERARRLRALTIRRTADLVIDASVDGVPVSVTLGRGSDQDVFLENPTSPAPILFHDLSGADWPDRLRRKFAPHLAAILENSAYAHTFALFLQAESDADREEFLLELGISGTDVDVVAARIGIVSEEERKRHLRWYRAVLHVFGHDHDTLTLDDEPLFSALRSAGLPSETARALVDAGGGEATRRDAGEGSPLRLLNDTGLDLRSLDEALRRDGDAGLHLTVTRRRFAQWLEVHGQRVCAVLAAQLPANAAKSSVRGLTAPASLALSIDPPGEELLAPVVELLVAAGFPAVAAALAQDPEIELARLAGAESVSALDAQAALLFDEEERRRALRERASQWRREIRLLAVLSRIGPAETRSTVREIDDRVGDALSNAYSSPNDLVEPVEQLFPQHIELRDWLAGHLHDSVLSHVPERHDLLERAATCGVAVDRLPVLQRALEAPRRDHARAVKTRSERLASEGVYPRSPASLTAPPPRRDASTKNRKMVTRVKVDASHDRRKRELGDEGEQWALAAIIGQVLRLSEEDRDRAIDQVCELLLTRFEGAAVEAALSHADLARSRGADEEDLIDELTGLLHVARHSDAFGFDLIGWLPVSHQDEPIAVCLEVKSSSSEGFHLTSSEWALAQRFHADDAGDRYAVLVVRRGKDRGLPTSMDLLVDPLGLHESGRLRYEVDGYTIAYRTEAGATGGTDIQNTHLGTADSGYLA